jgi:hypothetical protein
VYPVSSRAGLVPRSRMPWHFAGNREHSVVQTKKRRWGTFVPETQGPSDVQVGRLNALPCPAVSTHPAVHIVAQCGQSPALNAQKPLAHPSHRTRTIWFPSATLHGSTGTEAARIAWKLEPKEASMASFSGVPRHAILNFIFLFNTLHPDYGSSMSLSNSRNEPVSSSLIAHQVLITRYTSSIFISLCLKPIAMVAPPASIDSW